MVLQHLNFAFVIHTALKIVLIFKFSYFEFIQVAHFTVGVFRCFSALVTTGVPSSKPIHDEAAIKIDRAAERCVDCLLELIKTKVEPGMWGDQLDTSYMEVS